MLSLLVICLGLVAVDDGDASIPKDSAERAAYEAAQAKAGRDSRAHVRLALWCESHGLGAERMKHLAMAVLYDPSNGLARGLMGLVAYQGKWKRPDDVSRQVQDDPGRKALMQEYLRRRARTSDKAEDQWRLAVWCEENGLKDQAIAQYHAVLRRDPAREATWKRLGFKKVGGRWVKPEWQAAQKQESDQQNRANKHWKPLLEKWSASLLGRDKARRAEAQAGLAQVSDPRAVPAIWAVFAGGEAGRQKMAVRLLGQVDSPGSSRALTMLGLMSPSAEVRQEATQILRRRDPRDFAPLLIGLLQDTIKYEVRPINGPGSSGELVIKNPDVIVKRLYSPPPAPFIPILPGDSLSLDAGGLPVIDRFMLAFQTPLQGVPANTLVGAAAISGVNGPSHANRMAHTLGGSPRLQGVGAELDALVAQDSKVPVHFRAGGSPKLPLIASETVTREASIPIGQMMLQAQQVAQAAQEQLAGDVRKIEAYNEPIEQMNRRVRQLLADTVGTDLGADRVAWEKWVVDLFGYAYVAPSNSGYEPPTVVEQVPLAYQPPPMPITVSQQVTGVDVTHESVRQPRSPFHSFCFGLGTPVQTMDGPRPIEDLRGGDDVLTQNPRTGELKYQVLVAVFHNPPSATFRIELDDDAIVVTGIHRLWKAGKGWVMARDLKPGDVLRTLGGTASVKSIVEEEVQPVFNLQVADGESFFVGRSGVLAHDNSTINPTPEPFDAVAPMVASPGVTAPRSVLGR